MIKVEITQKNFPEQSVSLRHVTSSTNTDYFQFANIMHLTSLNFRLSQATVW